MILFHHPATESICRQFDYSSAIRINTTAKPIVPAIFSVRVSSRILALFLLFQPLPQGICFTHDLAHGCLCRFVVFKIALLVRLFF